MEIKLGVGELIDFLGGILIESLGSAPVQNTAQEDHDALESETPAIPWTDIFDHFLQIVEKGCQKKLLQYLLSSISQNLG